MNQENRIRAGLGLPPIKETKERDDPIMGRIKEPRGRSSRPHKERSEPQKPLKETMLYKTAQDVYHRITKNQIPKDHDKVLEMLHRMENEEKEGREIEDAKIKIKEIQRRKKEANHKKKLERRGKIKKFLRIGTKKDE